MSTQRPPLKAPVVAPSGLREIADGVWVIPDSDHVLMVPNVGIVVGARSTLVIDTGFGPENARVVLEQARRLSGARPVLLTHTHCHPEHGFGANVVSNDVTVVYNEAQWEELEEKGSTLLQLFRARMPTLAPMLDGVEFVRPDMLYTGVLKLDLGGKAVVLREMGGAHSRGDQAILVVGPKPVLFTGDLVEEGYFGILGDHESHVVPWIDRLHKLEALEAELVVPGHGLVGGREQIVGFRSYLELAKRRVQELRAAGETEAAIVERVGDELLALHPDWANRDWAKKAVEDLSWPARG